MNETATTATKAGGNTKPQLSKDTQSRRWCFTLNNWTKLERATLLHYFEETKALYIFGEEICPTTGTPHLQGYVEWKGGKRFSTLKKLNQRLSIRAARGSRKSNDVYCGKDACNVQTNLPMSIKDKLKLKFSTVVWKPWQLEIIELVKKPPSTRNIYWYWEPDGNVGKSFLGLYLSLHYQCLKSAGKAADTLYVIKDWMEAEGRDPEYDCPEIILVDITREKYDYTSYAVLEELKNNWVCSSKYKGANMWLNDMHVICFANSPPKPDVMSEDRFIVRLIKDNQLIIAKDEELPPKELVARANPLE